MQRHQNERNHLSQTLLQKDNVPAEQNGFVPGIHNLQTVGSSPLKRALNQNANLPRDDVYRDKGAGQVSTKMNDKKGTKGRRTKQ